MPLQNVAVYDGSTRSFLDGGGESGARIRALDWSVSTLGLPEHWPAGLRITLRLLLTTRHPMAVLWGAAQHCFQNDAFAGAIGPQGRVAAPGARACDALGGLWESLGQRVAQVIAGLPDPGGDAGSRVAGAWSWALSPVDDASAPHGVGGVLVVAAAATAAAVADQRRSFLKALDAALHRLEDRPSIASAATDALGRHLAVSRVGFGEVQADGCTLLLETNYIDGVAPLLGSFPLQAFGLHHLARQQAGELVIWSDAATDPLQDRSVYELLEARAGVCVPLVRDGRLWASFFVNHRESREWLAHEVTLIEAAAMRIAAALERIRAGALEAADRRKNQFLAVLSHELRGPLAPIRTAAELLASPRVDAAQMHWAQNVIQRQVRHMAALLDDLLDVGRITQGKLVLRSELLPLTTVVDAAVEAVRPLLDRKHHRLVIALPAPPPKVRADPMRLAQVLSNLLTNAVKYTDPGGLIELSGAIESSSVRLAVKDDGMGIAKESLPHIFELFSQGEDATFRSEGGLGIGLALVRGLVELHGGRVGARSDGPGRGSEFTVHLPLADVGEQAAAAPVGDEVPDNPAVRRVLVADDNVDAADSLALLLELAGHQVRIAHDGRAALTAANEFRPDAVLLDIGMPEMDGYAVAREIRRTSWGQSMHLIALTGWGHDDDRQRALDAGFDWHLTKPVDPGDLTALLAKRGR
jgi:signal transduction histidine kinase/CheY-like chemotaxis protein